MFNMRSEQSNPYEVRTMEDLVTPKQFVAIQNAANYRSINAEQGYQPVRQHLHSQVSKM
jgi:hypothetical protein